MNKARRTMLAKMMVVVFAVVMSVSLSAKADGFDLTTAQTDDTKVKSYKNGTDEALGTEFTFSVQPAWKLFADYGEYSTANRAITASFSSNKPVDIVYEFDTATAINAYKIQTSTTTGGTSHNTRAPHEWKFFGSTDGTTWTKLDSQSVASWNKSEQKSFMFFNDTAYRYYRLMITANGGDSYLELFSLEYGYVSGNYTIGESGVALTGDIGADFSIGYIDRTIDIAGHTLTVSALTGGGTITDSSSFDKTTTQTDATNVKSYVNGVETALSQPAWQAFGDFESYSSSGTPQHRVLCNPFRAPTDIDYDFSTATVIDSFRLTSGNNNSAGARAPKTMSFYGWDGADWMELGAWTGQTGWSRNMTRQYDFANTNAYVKYRIRFYEDNGDGILEFFKLEYGCHAKAGKVIVNVPNGETTTNANVTLTGNVRLIKDGAGTFVASKAGQTYIGGSEVSAGTLKAGASSDGVFGFGGSEIRIMSGGTFDMNGFSTRIAKYLFLLYGGKLADGGGSTSGAGASVVLKANSTFEASNNMYLGAGSASLSSIDLGGNTFSGTIASGKFLRLYNIDVEDGTVEASGAGALIASGAVATNVDFRLGCAVVVATDTTFPVRDYEALGGKRSTSNESGTMEVYGAFTPTSDSFYGCTLMDGSTLDLSTRSTTLNPYSNFTAGSTTLKFEANATINIHLGTRKTSGAVPLLSWTAETKPDNIDTVKFVRADEGRRYSLVVKENGLYACAGFIISIY